MNKEDKTQQQSQFLYQEEKKQKEQTGEKKQEKSISASFSFQFESPKADSSEQKKTVISEELNAAFCKPRSKEFMDILKKQELSAMSDEQIKRIIAREIVIGGASSMEDVVNLSTFMATEDGAADTAPLSAEEQAMVEEMSEEDVMDFLEMLNASFSEAIAREELVLKEALLELDKKAIDESYHLTKCPICPSHDIHILPKNHRLFFCHLTSGKLSPVFEEAKRLLFNGEASLVHVYKGCAFVVGSDGEVKKRIDAVEEPMELIIRNGWEELP